MNMKGFREPTTFYKCHVLMYTQLNELFVELFTLLIATMCLFVPVYSGC